ncbi:MAG: hypothetical protein IJT36_03390 [Alphaproteobacteria bacterium]|nr:hypothetical protein [Alphaproteobacteria bacterium]
MKIIGKIEWKDSDEVIVFTKTDEFLEYLRKEIDVLGIRAFKAITNVAFNKNNVDLAWKVYNIYAGEYGFYLPKKQFIIHYYQPEFNIEGKLETIGKYGTNRAKKRLNSYYALTDDFISSMSIKAIKKWVDRNHNKAIINYFSRRYYNETI